MNGYAFSNDEYCLHVDFAWHTLGYERDERTSEQSDDRKTHLSNCMAQPYTSPCFISNVVHTAVQHRAGTGPALGRHMGQSEHAIIPKILFAQLCEHRKQFSTRNSTDVGYYRKDIK
jgi:hypothetical protein